MRTAYCRNICGCLSVLTVTPSQRRLGLNETTAKARLLVQVALIRDSPQINDWLRYQAAGLVLI